MKEGSGRVDENLEPSFYQLCHGGYIGLWSRSTANQFLGAQPKATARYVLPCCLYSVEFRELAFSETRLGRSAQ